MFLQEGVDILAGKGVGLRGDALGLAVGIDRAVVLAAGAQVEPPADLAVSGDEGGFVEAGELVSTAA